MLKNISIFLFLAFVAPIVGQTNNYVSDYETIKKIEGLYFLDIKKSNKIDIKLSGRINFEGDQFGTIKRVISYPTLKVEF